VVDFLLGVLAHAPSVVRRTADTTNTPTPA
jgi:hypothetical protein